MTKKTITLLLIEDNPVDISLIEEIVDQLDDPGALWKLLHADRLSRGLEALGRGNIDAILLDLNLPDSQGLDTFMAVQKMAPATPIIMCTAIDDQALAIRAVNDGAQDYLVKGGITPMLLVRAVRYAIERKRMEQEKEKLIMELREALAQVKTLSGLLPICANCKKIRDDKGYWHQVDKFIMERTNANFSHGVCPQCAHNLYPGLFPDKEPE